MEPWKRDVLRLHEEAGFLFYFEEAQQAENSLTRFVIKGEAARGRLNPGGGMFLLDGQGRLLGQAVLLSDMEEKEEKRIGITREKRNSFLIKMIASGGEPVSAMEVNRYRRTMDSLWESVSIFSDCRIKDHKIERIKREPEEIPAEQTSFGPEQNHEAAEEIQKDLFKKNSKRQKLFLKILNRRQNMKK